MPMIQGRVVQGAQLPSNAEIKAALGMPVMQGRVVTPDEKFEKEVAKMWNERPAEPAPQPDHRKEEENKRYLQSPDYYRHVIELPIMVQKSLGTFDLGYYSGTITPENIPEGENGILVFTDDVFKGRFVGGAAVAGRHYKRLITNDFALVFSGGFDKFLRYTGRGTQYGPDGATHLHGQWRAGHLETPLAST